MVVVIEIPLLIHDCCRYGREAYADPYTLGHGVGPVPGGYGVRRRWKKTEEEEEQEAPKGF